VPADREACRTARIDGETDHRPAGGAQLHCEGRGETWIVEGTCEGRIAAAPRGRAGFGYDPVFLDPETDVTYAELDAARKDEISHRGRACAALRRRLSERA
jgi:XTP/dITP diphosphohydrolase